MAEGGRPNFHQLGNDLYRDERYEEALDAFSTALKCPGLDTEEKADLYNNRAACCLKLARYKEAATSASLCEYILETYFICRRGFYRKYFDHVHSTFTAITC